MQPWLWGVCGWSGSTLEMVRGGGHGELGTVPPGLRAALLGRGHGKGTLLLPPKHPPKSQEAVEAAGELGLDRDAQWWGGRKGVLP